MLHTQPTAHPDSGEVFIAASSVMRQVLDHARRAADSARHVLVCGEPGTGRELIARKIHQFGGRGDRPFVRVDCATKNIDVVLFGVRNFNSAEERRALERVSRSSQIVQAAGGTLFLKHVAELPARTQARLSRLLRDDEAIIANVGERVDLDMSVITAGDPSLEHALEDGGVRQDLFKRLSGWRLEVPPLRDRREDIPALAEHFTSAICEAAALPQKQLSDAAKSMLAALPWRGNANELRNLLETVIGRVAGATIGLEDVLAVVKLDGGTTSFPGGGSLREARVRFETEYIASVLAQHRWRIPDAAKTLGIQRSNLYRKMRSLRVKPTGSRPQEQSK